MNWVSDQLKRARSVVVSEVARGQSGCALHHASGAQLKDVSGACGNSKNEATSLTAHQLMLANNKHEYISLE